MPLPSSVLSSTTAVFLHALCASWLQAADPDPRFPSDAADCYQGHNLGNGQIPNQLFWESDAARFSSSALNASRSGSAERWTAGVHSVISLMMWSDTFENARTSTNPSFQAYFHWNDARRRYFARKRDGTIWSKNYNPDLTPKDAWISPHRPLDAADAGPGIRTYGDWYAARVAALAKHIDFSGVSLADHADQMADSLVWEQDFSPEIIAEFERRTGFTVPGATIPEKSQAIFDQFWVPWIDFMADGYAAWWAEMVNRIEDEVGRPVIMTLQKVSSAHSSRWKAADIRAMRAHLRRADQLYYRTEQWSLPDSRASQWSLSAAAGQMMSHFAKEPDVAGRVVMLPCSHQPSYVAGLDAMDLWTQVDKAAASYGMTLDEAGKTLFGNRSMRGTWTTLAWMHLANRRGELERAMTVTHRQHQRSHYPIADWTNILRPRYPVSPFGPAYYYSASLERYLDSQWVTWNGSRFRTLAKGNFFPGYFVSDAALGSLRTSAYPSAWIAESFAHLPADERARLTATAHVYDLSAIGTMPAAHAPLRFSSTCTGYGFVDQNRKLVIVVTRDDWTNSDVTGSVSVGGVADGSYAATSIFDGTTTGFTVTGGVGTFSTPLAAWETKAFEIEAPRPAAPRTLTAQAHPDGSVALAWEDASGHEAGFLVQRSVGASGIWTDVATCVPNGTTCTVGGLAAGASYSFRVQALGPNLPSDWSAPASATIADQQGAAPTITAHPVAASVTVGATATFTVAATGFPAPAYRWQRDGVAIAGATGASYTTPSTALPDDGASFRCLVSNGAGSTVSASATLSVAGIPPLITTQPRSAAVVAGHPVVFVVAATGTPAPSYQWQRDGAAIPGAVDRRLTIAAVSPADDGVEYRCVVGNSAGSVTTAAARLTVTPAGGTGTILRQWWNHVVASTIADVPVGTMPTSVTSLTQFESPSHVGDHYAQRVVGYVTPPQTGSYVFWIASDNDAELWLSTDADPANKVRIASVTGATLPRAWTKYPSQKSVPIALIAGASDYIEAVHLEITGGDSLAVGWAKPGEDTTLPSEVIPGSALRPWDGVMGGGSAPTVAQAASATPAPVTGAATTLSVLGADDGGEAALTYTWATTGATPAPVGFSANGTNAAKTTTATFAAAGTYSLQATIRDAAGLAATSAVTVVVQQTAITIQMTP